jgi:hypothetical protein
MDDTEKTPTGPVRDYVASVTINIAVPVAARTRGQVRNYVAQFIKPLIAVELAGFRDGQRLANVRQHDATSEDPRDVRQDESQGYLNAARIGESRQVDCTHSIAEQANKPVAPFKPTLHQRACPLGTCSRNPGHERRR